ncbi:alanine--tRNA ligase [candidate division WOR-3 bacterium]|nr:alanine--tRNA ligase [candidate division WOR-3 bacterium]
MLNTQELREVFLDFFKERKHTIVPSSSLTPKGDPTLLFTSAGMVQFKKLWAGEVPLPYKRAVSIQKCLRATDIGEVGKSAKYNTFFEMLGNFSFGDYFKQEAIKWAWEFITKVVKLSEDNLCVSVLNEDKESYKIWKDEIGLAKDKIYKLGKEDNFWKPVGGSGACGPCSEIFYDLGKDVGCKKPDCKPGCKCDRFPEIWNLVFPQYNSQIDGTLKPLKNKGVDTGLGLERFVMVVQGKKSIFETDTFKPIIDEIAQICHIKYEEQKVRVNIIADHIRAITFALSEGIYPSNIGRGYLLRRILRRAQKEAYEMGIKKPFLYKVVGVVVDVMRESYPELVQRRENIALVMKAEEESFLRTLEQGSLVFKQTLSHLKSRKIPGETVFRLYDTYGFPVELTEELAENKGFKIDKEKFDKIMKDTKEISKSASKFKETAKGQWKEFLECEKTKFAGYETLKTQSRIVKWRTVGKNVEIVLNRTPFYAEAGGQIGDKGKIYKDELEIEIIDTQWMGKLILHIGQLKKGSITNKTVTCEVNKENRRTIEKNHTATHLLHSALRKVLGDWVHQEGSLVKPERLRFDFTHFKPLINYEVEKIEELINSWILDNISVETYITSFEQAVKSGAMAIFGEKYGDRVKVVKVDDISMELCGGTHTRSTGEIGPFKITSETGIHAGIRRIEAITGSYAFQWLKKCEKELISISKKLEVEPFKVKDKVYELIESEEKLRNKIRNIEQTALLKMVPEILNKKKIIQGVNILTSKVQTENIENLRILADKLRAGKKRVGVLGTVINKKPLFIIFVSDDLKSKIKASDIAKELGKLAGGGGGGKDSLAQSGGKDPQKLQYILNQVPDIIKKIYLRY